MGDTPPKLGKSKAVNRLPPPSLPSYAGSPAWIRYRRILSERFNIKLRNEPDERWLDWQGHRLHLDVHEPQGKPRGTLILVHGAGGHGRLLAPLGEHIASLGWRAVAPDLPGYGLTIVRKGWRENYAEWPEFLAELTEMSEGPVVLLGLSVGGMTALRAAQLSPKAKGIIATTLVNLSEPETFVAVARWRWLGRLSLLCMRLTPWLMDRLPLPLGLVTPLEAMSSDPALQRWFKSEPLIGQRIVRGRFFRSLHQYSPPRPDFALHCPLLLVHPGADTWTPTAMSLPVFDAVPTPKRLQVLSNGSHMPAETPAWAELCIEVRAFLDAISSDETG